MIDLNRQQKKKEDNLGAVLAGLIPFLVIILGMMMWRL